MFLFYLLFLSIQTTNVQGQAPNKNLENGIEFSKSQIFTGQSIQGVETNQVAPPLIENFDVTIFEQELVTSSLTWHLTDLEPDLFTLYGNGTEVLTGTWQSGIPVVFSLYGWDLGQTNFTMVARNQAGLVSSLSVMINIVDTLEPILNEPLDFYFNEGDTNVNLEWIAEDFNPANWTLYENNISYRSGNWESKVPIRFNLDDYKWGKYNMTLFVFDVLGNVIADTVIVNVFLTSDHTYTENTETKSTNGGIMEDINTVYGAAAIVVGVVVLSSILGRKR